jgi:hypothetical protein
MSISDLVRDWGGFEELVETLHETGRVSVERGVVLQGRSGAPRQIDVLIRHKQDLYEHLVIAECKYWNSRVERADVDVLAATIRELGASRGVIFSTKGFQSGAITQAAHENIDLFTVRDLTTEEWGLPGRHIDFFVHVIQPSVGNMVTGDGGRIGVIGPVPNNPVQVELSFGTEGPLSSTPTLEANGRVGPSLEIQLAAVAQKALDMFVRTCSTLNDGVDGIYLIRKHVSATPSVPFMVPFDKAVLTIPKIDFHLGIKIVQTRIMHDRAKNYLFALAIENCVNGRVSSAARPIDASLTELAPVLPREDKSGGPILENGSILRVQIKGYFPFEEMEGVKHGEVVRMSP